MLHFSEQGAELENKFKFHPHMHVCVLLQKCAFKLPPASGYLQNAISFNFIQLLRVCVCVCVCVCVFLV